MLIVQAVAVALNVTIQIVESNPRFSPITTVNPVQERNSLPTITMGHIDECHYVSTTPLQSNASISMYNKSTIIDIQSSINKHFIMSMYAIGRKEGDPGKASNSSPVSLLPAASKVCERTALNQMITYLEEEKRLTNHQSGNKKLHSTEPLNILISDTALESMD